MGGIPVVEVTRGGIPVTESDRGVPYEIAANGRGIPVRFVARGGAPFKGGGYPVLSSAKTVMIGDSNTYTSSTVGPLEMFCALSQGKFQYGANKGVNGNTTTQMSARFATDVVALAPYACIIMGKVNDIGASINDATGLNNYTSMINSGKAAGIRMIVFASPPYASAPSTITTFNTSLQTLCGTLGAEFYDPWAAGGIRAGDGTWADGSYSSDGVHATPKANRIAMSAVLPSIRKPNYTPTLVTSNTDPANKISNGLFINSSAGTPTGWSADASLTPSIAAGYVGNRWTLSFSALAAYKSVSGPSAWSGLSAGDTVRMSGRVITTGLEDEGVSANPGQGRADMTTFINWTGGTPSILLHPSLSADIDGVFEADLVVPAGSVGATLLVLIGPRSGSITGSYSIEQLSLKKIS